MEKTWHVITNLPCYASVDRNTYAVSTAREIGKEVLLTVQMLLVYLVTKNLRLGIAAAAVMTGFYLKGLLVVIRM